MKSTIDKPMRIHKTAAGDTAGRVGRHKAEEVVQSPGAAADHKATGDEDCREAADSLEGQATMTQEVCSQEQQGKKNQDEAEGGNRGKQVVDDKDTT